MTKWYKDMTENEVQAILGGILKYWKSLTPAEVKSLLKILIVRGDLPKCAACGKPIFNMDDFSWDHVMPESKGGPTQIGNLAPMHSWCNVAKGDDTDEQYFCHVDPELLEQMMKNHKKRGSRSSGKSKKKYDNLGDKRRKHVRVNGWTDMTSYNKGRNR